MDFDIVDDRHHNFKKTTTLFGDAKENKSRRGSVGFVRSRDIRETQSLVREPVGGFPFL